MNHQEVITPQLGSQELASERLPIDTDAVFEGFDWREGEKPEHLVVNESGFLEDHEGYWYLTRKAKNIVGLKDIAPEDLYNGHKASSWNSTEGAGLYFANYPGVVRNLKIGVRPSKEPKELYVCKVKPTPERVLDVTSKLRGKAAGQKAAAILLRSRGIMPGIPSPSRNAYDRMYGDASVVTTPPLAMARLMSGKSMKTAGDKLKPRWAIVRDLELIDVVGHASLD